MASERAETHQKRRDFNISRQCTHKSTTQMRSPLLMEIWALPLNKFSVPQERGRFHPTDAAPYPPKLSLHVAGLRRGLASRKSSLNSLLFRSANPTKLMA